MVEIDVRQGGAVQLSDVRSTYSKLLKGLAESMAALEGASEEELRKANSRLKVAHSKIDPSDSEAVMEAQRVDFIDKYQIKIDEHQISFELGKTLRIDFLREAQALAQGLYGRNALWPERLKKWTKNERFNQTPDPYRSDNISIDRKDLQQEVQHWRMSQFHDLALAHVAHFVVTGEDLFDGDLVATVPGALFFHAQGLSVYYDEGEGTYAIWRRCPKQDLSPS